MTRRAFTLIELLVVIAIISLLVAILMPSLQRTKDLAKKSVCMNNMHNVNTQVHTYLAENSQRFAGPFTPHAWDLDSKTWVIQLLDLSTNHPYKTWRHVTNMGHHDIGTGGLPDQPAPWGDDLAEATQRYEDYKKLAALFFCPSAPMSTMIRPAIWSSPGAIEAESTTYHAPVHTWSYRHRVQDSQAPYAGVCFFGDMRDPSRSVQTAEGAFHLWPVIDNDVDLANLYGIHGTDWNEATHWDHGKGRIHFSYFDGHIEAAASQPYSFVSTEKFKEHIGG